MTPIRLRVTLFPDTAGAGTLRTKNMCGVFEITDAGFGRIEIVDAAAPGIERDDTAFLGSLVKLEVEAMP